MVPGSIVPKYLGNIKKGVRVNALAERDVKSLNRRWVWFVNYFVVRAKPFTVEAIHIHPKLTEVGTDTTQT